MGKLLRILDEELLRLWEADYANTAGDKYWGDVGGGVLAISKKSKQILMAYRSAAVNEPHTWGVVGGALDDADKGVKDAVYREFFEETGYRGQLKLFPAYVFRTPSGSFEYHNFIGLIDDEFNPCRDWETERFEWMSFDEMMRVSPKHFGLKNLLKDSKSLQTIKQLTK